MGNTPTNRGNMRDELARDRLRKKLKKRKEQKEKVNVKNDGKNRFLSYKIDIYDAGIKGHKF